MIQIHFIYIKGKYRACVTFTQTLLCLNEYTVCDLPALNTKYALKIHVRVFENTSKIYITSKGDARTLHCQAYKFQLCVALFPTFETIMTI
jgi:hypothetical protein